MCELELKSNYKMFVLERASPVGNLIKCLDVRRCSCLNFPWNELANFFSGLDGTVLIVIS